MGLTHAGDRPIDLGWGEAEAIAKEGEGLWLQGDLLGF